MQANLFEGALPDFQPLSATKVAWISDIELDGLCVPHTLPMQEKGHSGDSAGHKDAAIAAQARRPNLGTFP
jgi:hypothetical protein